MEILVPPGRIYDRGGTQELLREVTSCLCWRRAQILEQRGVVLPDG
jgi:hypothetical protein